MKTPISRRRFVQTAALAAIAPAAALPAAKNSKFSFVLLGDLHFDRLDHHDMGWIEKHKSGDLTQIRNYSRITAEITPKLFAAVRETIADLRNTAAPCAFVLQAGDLVEGLCGSEELAARQNREALAFIQEANLGVPFVFTKGNHDVTGDGAIAAFSEVFHPFLSHQTGAGIDSANYTLERGTAHFCFFDAYDKASLDWLEAILAKRTARHLFVVVHPPVAPYGARAAWHLYASERDRPRREKLLDLLGKNEVFVLGGHIHRFNAMTRLTPGGGRFVQLAVSSVINSLEVKPRTELSGVAAYNGDQVRVEPNHSPETEAQRRAVYEAERKFVTSFEYADLPGYAVVTVDGESVTVTHYSGVSREVWRTLDLGKLRTA